MAVDTDDSTSADYGISKFPEWDLEEAGRWSENFDSVTGYDDKDDLPDMGEMYGLLSSDRRRDVLRYLEDNGDGPFERMEMVTAIAALENDCDQQELGHQQKKRVTTGLHQSSLPKLAEHNIVEYSDENRISKGENFEAVVNSFEHLKQGFWNPSRGFQAR